MHIFLFLLLFLQFPTAEDYQKMTSPQAQLARAEEVIKGRQESADRAVAEESKSTALHATWHQQGIIRNKEKQDFIEKSKAVSILDDPAKDEAVLKQKQKAADRAVEEEAKAATLQTNWHQQAVARTKEKQDLIEKVKVANHLDATWTWDDATSKFVQKK